MKTDSWTALHDRVGNPMVLRAWLAALDQRLEATPDDAALLQRRLDFLRAIGDIPAALIAADHLLARHPENAAARRLKALLNGDEHAAVDGVDRTGPVPFLRLSNVFAPSERAEIWDTITARDHDGSPAAISAGADQTIVVPDIRLAWRYRPQADLRARLLKQVRQVIDQHRVFDRLGLTPFHPTRIEMQVTRYTDAGRYRIHRDSGPGAPGRRLTFLFYFFRQPRRFAGGDLLLFDELAPSHALDPTKFTRLIPQDNSLLLFPSDRLHAVTVVEQASSDPLDGRWSVNGWLHANAGDAGPFDRSCSADEDCPRDDTEH